MMTRHQARRAIIFAVGGLLLLTVLWGAVTVIGRMSGGKDPSTNDPRLKVEPDFMDGDVSYFATPYPNLFVGMKAPPHPEWSSGLVKESSNGRSGLPQFARVSPTAVAYFSIDRMDVPPEVEKLTQEQKVLNLAAMLREEWGKRLNSDLQTVASTQHDVQISLDGKPRAGAIISVYATKKEKDKKAQQYRVSETFTVIDAPADGKNPSVLVVTLRMEQEVDGDGIVVKMSDSTRIEKDGKITFLPVKLHPDLETARASFALVTKRPQ